MATSGDPLRVAELSVDWRPPKGLMRIRMILVTLSCEEGLMKLHVLADIHAEFSAFSPPKTDADVIVLAGDIHIGPKGLHWAKETVKDRHVVYVLGNHEYYGKSLPKLTNFIRTEARGSNVHVLENDKFVIDDVVFAGCTLWTDFKLLGDPTIAAYEATQKMTDYSKIRVSPGYRKLRPADTAALHHKSLVWLAEELENFKGYKRVVVTHHAPSRKSVPNWYVNDITTAAYASHLEPFISLAGIDLWIHGHVHGQSDYKVGGTRVVCNARGYPDEKNNGFLPDLVIEL